MCRLKSTGFVGGHRSDLWDPLVAGDKVNMARHPWNWRVVPGPTAAPSRDSSHQNRVSGTCPSQQAGCVELGVRRCLGPSPLSCASWSLVLTVPPRMGQLFPFSVEETGAERGMPYSGPHSWCGQSRGQGALPVGAGIGLGLLCSQCLHLSADGHGLESGEGHGSLRNLRKSHSIPTLCTHCPDNFRGLCSLKPSRGPRVQLSAPGPVTGCPVSVVCYTARAAPFVD